MAAVGVPGRGKSEGNATPYHYACLLVGFAGDQPSDAADAAATALPFEWQHSEPYSKTPRILGNLQKVLESIITGTWETAEKLEETTFCAPSMLISLNLGSVQIMWPNAKGYLELTEYYGPPPGVEFEYRIGGIRKQTLVTDRMLLLAASLWRDNKPLATDSDNSTLNGAAGAATPNSTLPDQPAPQAKSLSKTEAKRRDQIVQPAPRKVKNHG